MPRPPRVTSPMLELDRLTASGMIVPLPHPGPLPLRTQWHLMLRGGIRNICMRQLRLRKKKAAEAPAPADSSASAGLQLLRRTLSDFRPAELAFIAPEDSLQAVWEVADGDDGLDWIMRIPRKLGPEYGHFTDEELDTWCNLEGTVRDLVTLLDRKIEKNPPDLHSSPREKSPLTANR